MTHDSWESVIGLEVHVQLSTKSKLFSGASTAYGAAPNTQACEIDLGLPGVLPALNKEAVIMAVKFGLSIDAEINRQSVFARKHYFYPDLPKGYQISQFDQPIVKKGWLEILEEENLTSKKIGITRAHLEEDAGKSLHEALPDKTGIDLNRAGTPLLEIVSEPDLRCAKDAVNYLKTLHALVCCLEICDGNLQEGSFRCDANVSVRKKGETELGVRAEIKNINSFKFVEKAINYEIERQINLRENNQPILQETRLYDSAKNETRSMRSKENANDYRYFPDPDLLPVILSQAFIDNIHASLPELPRQKHKRFQHVYGLSAYEAAILSGDKNFSDYFEKTVQLSPPKLAANWILGEISAALNKQTIDIAQSPVSPEKLAGLLARIQDNTLSNTIAKKVFEHMWETQQTADSIIQAQGLQQINDDAQLIQIIDQLLADNPVQVRDYQAGKDKLLSFFIGLAMKASLGKANPALLMQLLKTALEKKDRK